MKNERLLFLGIIIALCIFIGFVCRGNRPQSGDSARIQALQDSIAAIITERNLINDELDRLRFDTEQSETTDSILNALYLSNQQIHKQLDAKLSEVPRDINRIAGNNDSLRAAYRRY